MSEEKFQDEAALKAWLKKNGVDEDDADEAAKILFANKFNKPSTLIDITPDLLQISGVSVPLAMTLSNKLKDKQQQNGKLRCCSRMAFLYSICY
jgi:hypothetical protein